MKKKLGFLLKERLERGGGRNDVTIVTKMSARRLLLTQ
jgi:hypothetical protein